MPCKIWQVWKKLANDKKTAGNVEAEDSRTQPIHMVPNVTVRGSHPCLASIGLSDMYDEYSTSEILSSHLSEANILDDLVPEELPIDELFTTHTRHPPPPRVTCTRTSTQSTLCPPVNSIKKSTGPRYPQNLGNVDRAVRRDRENVEKMEISSLGRRSRSATSACDGPGPIMFESRGSRKTSGGPPPLPVRSRRALGPGRDNDGTSNLGSTRMLIDAGDGRKGSEGASDSGKFSVGQVDKERECLMGACDERSTSTGSSYFSEYASLESVEKHRSSTTTPDTEHPKVNSDPRKYRRTHTLDPIEPGEHVFDAGEPSNLTRLSRSMTRKSIDLSLEAIDSPRERLERRISAKIGVLKDDDGNARKCTMVDVGSIGSSDESAGFDASRREGKAVAAGDDLLYGETLSQAKAFTKPQRPSLPIENHSTVSSTTTSATDMAHVGRTCSPDQVTSDSSTAKDGPSTAWVGKHRTGDLKASTSVGGNSALDAVDAQEMWFHDVGLSLTDQASEDEDVNTLTLEADQNSDDSDSSISIDEDPIIHVERTHSIKLATILEPGERSGRADRLSGFEKSAEASSGLEVGIGKMEAKADGRVTRELMPCPYDEGKTADQLLAELGEQRASQNSTCQRSGSERLNRRTEPTNNRRLVRRHTSSLRRPGTRRVVRVPSSCFLQAMTDEQRQTVQRTRQSSLQKKASLRLSPKEEAKNTIDEIYKELEQQERAQKQCPMKPDTLKRSASKDSIFSTSTARQAHTTTDDDVLGIRTPSAKNPQISSIGPTNIRSVSYHKFPKINAEHADISKGFHFALDWSSVKSTGARKNENLQTVCKMDKIVNLEDLPEAKLLRPVEGITLLDDLHPNDQIALRIFALTDLLALLQENDIDTSNMPNPAKINQKEKKARLRDQLRSHTTSQDFYPPGTGPKGKGYPGRTNTYFSENPQKSPFCTDLKAAVDYDRKQLNERPTRQFPVILESMVSVMEEHLDSEGIYRISGAQQRMKQMQQSFCDQWQEYHKQWIRSIHYVSVWQHMDYEGMEVKPHDIAGLIKRYLRELQDPLLSIKYSILFLSADRIQNLKQKMRAICLCFLLLTNVHKKTTLYMLRHLKKVCERSAYNKMTLTNIAVCLGPCFFSMLPQKDGTDIAKQATNICKLLIKYADILNYLPAKILRQTRQANANLNTINSQKDQRRNGKSGLIQTISDPAAKSSHGYLSMIKNTKNHFFNSSGNSAASAQASSGGHKKVLHSSSTKTIDGFNRNYSRSAQNASSVDTSFASGLDICESELAQQNILRINIDKTVHDFYQSSANPRPMYKQPSIQGGRTAVSMTLSPQLTAQQVIEYCIPNVVPISVLKQRLQDHNNSAAPTLSMGRTYSKTYSTDTDEGLAESEGDYCQSLHSSTSGPAASSTSGASTQGTGMSRDSLKTVPKEHQVDFRCYSLYEIGGNLTRRRLTPDVCIEEIRRVNRNATFLIKYNNSNVYSK